MRYHDREGRPDAIRMLADHDVASTVRRSCRCIPEPDCAVVRGRGEELATRCSLYPPSFLVVLVPFLRFMVSFLAVIVPLLAVILLFWWCP